MSKAVRKAAGFVVYRKNCDEIIEYLLMQASYANHHWTPPKGHLEENESNMDAAVRETDEEAGIKMKDLSVDHNFEKVLKYEPKDKPFTKQVTYYLARLINPETSVVLSNEHQDYKWLPLVEAKHLASYPEMQELLDDCENYLVKTNVK
ncbi:bis(5'-nucleosyl)-tetraphosphatase [asymmetrical] [Aphis gossypii]|uniref:Bis(5'-nucleosyl)-tetraphosphatase [asymmetrical] n=1 Tax=Aphis gossypii TaxID=80765 RepID=A0A9P0IMK9_APHGO|nr:bis(5'-nucleosyl)-tetraphosphatase [asymmetrical] [Aphis gossypii]CAH1711412.1 unnamed protein product [Aphis gossypii]